MKMSALSERYGKSQQGHFWVKDLIGVPHPYCITPKHVEIAADRFGGRLGEEAISEAEKQGVGCGMKGCQLPFAKHEQALLISCQLPLHNAQGETDEELRQYLIRCKPLCESDGYAGFAFLKEDT